MNRLLKFLIIPLQLLTIGCAIKVDLEKQPAGDVTALQNMTACVDSALPKFDTTLSMLEKTGAFRSINKSCKGSENLRVTRFELGMRGLGPHCGAELLTMLTFGLIPATCPVLVGGTICLKGSSKEECFGPHFFRGHKARGILASPLHGLSNWISEREAKKNVLRTIIELNVERITAISSR